MLLLGTCIVKSNIHLFKTIPLRFPFQEWKKKGQIKWIISIYYTQNTVGKIDIDIHLQVSIKKKKFMENKHYIKRGTQKELTCKYTWNFY